MFIAGNSLKQIYAKFEKKFATSGNRKFNRSKTQNSVCWIPVES